MVSRMNGGFPPLSQLREEMDRFLGEVFGTAATSLRGATPARGFPAINMWEDAENVYAEAELPGLKAEDVEISVVGPELTLKGKRADARPEGAAYHRRERSAGDFTRAVRLPVAIDADKVHCLLADGVLLITLPKAQSAKPRKIKVTTVS